MDDVRVAPPDRLAQINLRVAAGNLPGVRLPAANTLASLDGATVLWLGPDEWLVLGPVGARAALARRVSLALGERPGSVVDVSAQRAHLVIAGATARDLLAHGCALDLHPSAFPVGRCAQTMLAQAQVILWHPAADEFHLLVRSSYTGYLVEWLADAATG